MQMFFAAHRTACQAMLALAFSAGLAVAQSPAAPAGQSAPEWARGDWRLACNGSQFILIDDTNTMTFTPHDSGPPPVAQDRPTRAVVEFDVTGDRLRVRVSRLLTEGPSAPIGPGAIMVFERDAAGLRLIGFTNEHGTQFPGDRANLRRCP